MKQHTSLVKLHIVAKSGTSHDCKFCPSEKDGIVWLEKECVFNYLRIVQLEAL